MNADLVPLARTSLRAPRDAADRIMTLGLPRDVLWTALALVAVVNTFLVLLAVNMSTPPLELPGYFQRPIALFLLITGMTVIYVHAIYWAGLMLGGKGSLNDVLALVIWFQVLRAVAQVAVVVLSLAVPVLGLMLSLAILIWGAWIILNFIAAAMHLPSVAHALGVLIVSAVGLVIGLGLLLALIGTVTQGVS